MEFRASQLEDCAEQVDELTEQNRFLEDKVRRLCELPKDEGGKRERDILRRALDETQSAHELLLRESK